MAAKSSSVPQGVSATLPNLNLTKKTGIYHVEVWIFFLTPGSDCGVMSWALSPSPVAQVIFYVVSRSEYKFYASIKTLNVKLTIRNSRW